MLPCSPPQTRPSKTNQDVIDNSLARDLAYRECNARYQCLVSWIKAAGTLNIPTECVWIK